MNIIYLPVKSGDETKTLRNQYGMHPPADVFVDEMYDFSQARYLLSLICQSATGEIADKCKGDMSMGPYLFTYAAPASRLSEFPPPLLFVDLSKVHPDGFLEFISAYKEQVKRGDQFPDGERIDTFRLRLLHILLTASTCSESILNIVHMLK